MLPIILSAYLGGLGPGLLATLAAAAGLTYFFLPPVHHFSRATSADCLQWSIFILNGILISTFNEALHRSRRQTMHLASFPQLNPNPVLEMDLIGTVTYANPGPLAALEKLGPPYGLIDFRPHDWKEILQDSKAHLGKIYQRQVGINEAVFGVDLSFAEAYGV